MSLLYPNKCLLPFTGRKRGTFVPDCWCSYGGVGLFSLIAISSIFLSLGCGGGGSSSPTPSPSPSPSPSVQVSIQPSNIVLAPQAMRKFASNVVNSSSQSVEWSVAEGAEGGSIDGAGLYTAPATAGIYHVIVRSAAVPSQTATATITVPVVVTVSPSDVTTVSEPVTFTSSVNHPQNGSVTWKILEGDAGGRISQGGIYTPPGLGGVFHVVATSAVDGSTQGTATVNVPSGGATGVIK